MAGLLGLFGSGARNSPAAYLPTPQDPNSPIPRALLIGAMLQDVGNNLRGSGATDNQMQARMLGYQLQQRAMLMKAQQAIARAAAGLPMQEDGDGSPPPQAAPQPPPKAPAQAPDPSLTAPDPSADATPPDPGPSLTSQVGQDLGGTGGLTPDAQLAKYRITAPQAPAIPPPPVVAPPQAPTQQSLVQSRSPRRPVTMRDMAPAIASMSMIPGSEDLVKNDIALFTAADPKVTYDNGFGHDQYGNQVGGYLPTLEKDQIPLYDAQHRFAGVKNADGSVQSVAEMTRAQKDAENASAAAYAGPKAYGEAAGKTAVENPNTLETHDINGVPTTMTRAQWLSMSNGGAPAPASGPQADANAKALLGPNGALDPRAFYKSFVMAHEGKLNPSDMNGSPTFMGFNQAANPDIDVTKLTPDTAAERFANNYFGPSGAAHLSPALAAIHADTSFINPTVAKGLLAQSGGDPAKYMALRQAWQARLVQTNPAAAKYAQAWATRNADLSALAGQLSGQSGAQAPAQAPAAPQPGVGPGIHGLNKDDEKTVQGFIETAKQAEDLAALGHQFMKLNGSTATGMGYSPVEVPIPFSHGGDVNLNLAAPIMAKLHTNIPAMDNLSTQMALALRTPGQRITQMEFQKNLASVPGKEHFGAQNAATVAGYDARAATRRSYATFAQNWLAAHGSLQGMDDAFRAQQSQPGRQPVGLANAPRKGRVLTYNPATGGLE